MKNIIKKKLKNFLKINLFFKDNIIYLKGKNGVLSLNLSNLIKKKKNLKKKEYYSFCSTFLRLIEKQILGVSLGFVKRLIFVGVGYRVESIENDIIKFKLGYSHFVFVKIPKYIKVFLVKKSVLSIESIDDQLLNEFCIKIQKLKFPDCYKGKGILYKNQKIELKEGKKKNK